MEELNVLKGECERIIRSLRYNEESAFQEMPRLITKLVAFLQNFLIQAERWNEEGADFPIEVILQQVRNLDEAYREKDVIMLADTLEFEIIVSLTIYMENVEN